MQNVFWEIISRISDHMLWTQNKVHFSVILILKPLYPGIQVRTNKEYLMHHKFLVVDREKVITGSFNWTSHATTANNENMIITNNPQIVRPYVDEFDRLWKEFDLSSGR